MTVTKRQDIQIIPTHQGVADTVLHPETNVGQIRSIAGKTMVCATDATSTAPLPTDADTLGGNLPAYYAKQSELTTLSDHRGYKSSKVITDWNVIVDNGKYSAYNALNAPSQNSTILCEVIRETDSSNTVTQIAIDAFGEKPNSMYIRTKSSNEWAPWRRLITQDDMYFKLDKITQKHLESLNQELPFGLYRFYKPTEGFPPGYTSNSDFFLHNMSTLREYDPFQRQLLYDIRSNRMFSRLRSGGNLGDWAEVLTSTRSNIQCVPKPGFTIHNNGSIQMNNEVHFHLEVKAGTTWNAGHHLVATLPTGKIPGVWKPMHCVGIGNAETIRANCFSLILNNGQVWIELKDTFNDVNIMIISGVYIL